VRSWETLPVCRSFCIIPSITPSLSHPDKQLTIEYITNVPQNIAVVALMSVVILECECIMHEAYQLPRDSVCATGNTAAKPQPTARQNGMHEQWVKPCHRAAISWHVLVLVTRSRGHVPWRVFLVAWLSCWWRN